MRTALILLLVINCCAAVLLAQSMAPLSTTAGNGVTVNFPEDGTLYLIGPTARITRKVSAGPVQINANELQDAGRYFLLLKSGSRVRAAKLYVAPANAEKLSFLAQPSRVPAGAPDAISGTAFVFDGYHNLVLKPEQVKFDLSVADGPHVSRVVTSNNGVAWTRMASGKKEGAAQFVASLGATDVRRVVQQVAAEPCNLRMRAEPDKRGILVSTDLIRDCAGNAVPDGTIVTFTQVDRSGLSTVDARIKRGIATAELPAPNGAATISVASGVVAGNEIAIHGGSSSGSTAHAGSSGHGGAQ